MLKRFIRRRGGGRAGCAAGCGPALGAVAARRMLQGMQREPSSLPPHPHPGQFCTGHPGPSACGRAAAAGVQCSPVGSAPTGGGPAPAPGTGRGAAAAGGRVPPHLPFPAPASGSHQDGRVLLENTSPRTREPPSSPLQPLFFPPYITRCGERVRNKLHLLRRRPRGQVGLIPPPPHPAICTLSFWIQGNPAAEPALPRQ